MKPVYMTKFGRGNGNCLTACIASLLECGIDDLPDFSAIQSEWHMHTAKWLQSRGFETMFVPVESMPSMIVTECLCIAIFKTDGTEDHAKIGRWHSRWDDEQSSWLYRVEEEFDPNPKRSPVGELRAVLLIFQKIQGVSAAL